MGALNTLAAGCPAQTRVIVRFATASAMVGVVAACVFQFVPQFDVSVAQQFYAGDGRFAGADDLFVRALRMLLMVAYAGACVVAAFGLAASLMGVRSRLTLSTTQWLFALLCLAMGPGLVANQIFKDNWGRARPRHIVEFGGDKPFTAALVKSDNCERNCSFVSGEASSMFALLFAAAAVFRRRVLVLIAAGIVLGGTAGLIRMQQGAHFLSDVVFAGVFMALTVAALFLCFEARAAGGMARVRGAILGEAPAT